MVRSLAPVNINTGLGFTRELVLKSRSAKKGASFLGIPLIGIVSIIPPRLGS